MATIGQTLRWRSETVKLAAELLELNRFQPIEAARALRIHTQHNPSPLTLHQARYAVHQARRRLIAAGWVPPAPRADAVRPRDAHGRFSRPVSATVIVARMAADQKEAAEAVARASAAAHLAWDHPEADPAANAAPPPADAPPDPEDPPTEAADPDRALAEAVGRGLLNGIHRFMPAEARQALADALARPSGDWTAAAQALGAPAAAIGQALGDPIVTALGAWRLDTAGVEFARGAAITAHARWVPRPAKPARAAGEVSGERPTEAGPDD